MKALVINNTRSHYGFVIEVEQKRDGSYYDSVTDLIYEARELQFQWQETPVDWSSFRREAAKDILCALIGHKDSGVGTFSFDSTSKVEMAIAIADRLVNRLK